MGLATTPTNPNLFANYPKFPKSIPVTTDQTINQGDLVWWDAVNGTLKPVTKTSHVAVAAAGGFCGVSNDTQHINLYGEESLAALGVTRNGTVSLLTTPGEFYKNFQEVTVNETATGSSQTVSLVGVTSSNRVGWVIVTPPLVAKGAAGSTPVEETLTGAEGVRARVWLEPKFPATTGL